MRRQMSGWFVLIALCLLHVVVLCRASHVSWIAVADRSHDNSATHRENNIVSRSRRQATTSALPPKITMFHVETRIAVRFASTTIRTNIRNNDTQSRLLTFDLPLPLNAYISKFTMVSDDVTYYGHAVDRCTASTEALPADVSIAAIERNQYVVENDFNRNIFTVTVNAAPKASVKITIEYQELLGRQSGWYTQRISIRPGQVIRNMIVSARVMEPQGIVRSEAGIDTREYAESVSSLIVNSIDAEQAQSATDSYYGRMYSLNGNIQMNESLTSSQSTNSIHTLLSMQYDPSMEEQAGHINRDRKEGVYGDFILRYDVAPSQSAVGSVVRDGSKFTHRFAPRTLVAVNKRVVFILDTSGSMTGRKLRYTKEAMKAILGQLSGGDKFNIITFSEDVSQWKENVMISVNETSIADAKYYVGRLQAYGPTNLNAAMLTGFSVLESSGSMESSSDNPQICFLFVLSDGKPSVGEVRNVYIERNVREANRGRCSLVTLAFGRQADYNALTRLALQSRGIARKIYETSSAEAQLQGVFGEVATPFLFEIVVEYLNNAVLLDSLSTTQFSYYFNGSEIVITGALSDQDAASLPVKITAVGADGAYSLRENVDLTTAIPKGVHIPDDFLHRSYAFLVLRELSDQYTLSNSPLEKHNIIRKAKEISAQYNLLTPVMAVLLTDSESQVGATGSWTERGDGTVDVGDASGTTLVPTDGYQWKLIGPAYGDVNMAPIGIGNDKCQILTTTLPTTTMSTTNAVTTTLVTTPPRTTAPTTPATTPTTKATTTTAPSTKPTTNLPTVAPTTPTTASTTPLKTTPPTTMQTTMTTPTTKLTTMKTRAAITEEATTAQLLPIGPVVLTRYSVDSHVTERYARTFVTASYIHDDETNQPIEFSLQVPSSSFISNLYVDVGPQRYRGVVQNIQQDRWKELIASREGQPNLALFARRDPSKDAFVMVIPNVARNTPVIFVLVYEELLDKTQGSYKQRINIYPKQVTESLDIDVVVTEPQQISDMTVTYEGQSIPRTDLDLSRGITRESSTRSRFRYSPSASELREVSDTGLRGDIVINYQLVDALDGSHTQAQGDYFVHFFSPAGQNPLSKQIVFVIDVSGSMYGAKLQQTKEALKTMLDNLESGDYFNIITFSDGVEYWKEVNRLAPATTRYITQAKAYIDNLRDDSETNLNEAVVKAVELLDSESRYDRPGDNFHSMIILLTDGIPSVGVTDQQDILNNARLAIGGRHSLNTLGFGRLVDFDLLVKLAYENNGRARMIYEGTTATEQIQGFYFELSRPLLSDVRMAYPGGVVDEATLTKHAFPIFYEGSELVVAGKVQEDRLSNTIQGTIEVVSDLARSSRDITIDTSRTSGDLSRTRTVPEVVRRIWLMKTLEGLIRKYGETTTPNRRAAIAERIIQLSKDQNFVTPLTPLTLIDHETGLPVDEEGGSGVPLPLPAYSRADTERNLLEEAIDNDLSSDAAAPIDAPLAVNSSEGIDIVSLEVSSVIVLRYATTTIVSEMVNDANTAGQAVFKQKIPTRAFITGVSLILNGQEYSSEVADPQDTAGLGLGRLEIGPSGGILAPLDLENNLLVVSVPIDARNSAVFTVTYEEMLPRRLGVIKQKIGLFPGELVDSMNLRTIIIEPQGIGEGDAYIVDRSNIQQPLTLTSFIDKPSTSRWEVIYSPGVREQAAISPNGFAGDYTMCYDVIHAENAGNIQILDDYFVQHFSPSGLSVLRKHVVFVIDVSGSMAGTKLDQVKDALSAILDDMPDDDKFNVIPFSDDVDFLDESKMLQATKSNIIRAKGFIRRLRERKNTNLHKAIIAGVNMLRAENVNVDPNENVVSMVIVLTDGNPNHGEIDKAVIERNVESAINDDFSLFCLGFGEDLDFPFLERMALQNHGVARQIPERADAGKLLEDFYFELATPLLRDVDIRYSRGIEGNSLSQGSFSNYFNGSELVMVGKLLPNLRYRSLTSYVYARTSSDDITLRSRGNIMAPDISLLDAEVPDSIIQRIWANHIIQSLRQERARNDFSPEYTTPADDEIRDMSITYSFFNPSTVMLLKQPDGLSNEAEPFVIRFTVSPLPRRVREKLADYFRFEAPSAPKRANAYVTVPSISLDVCLENDPWIGTILTLLDDPVNGILVTGLVGGDAVELVDYIGERTFIEEITLTITGPTDPHELRFTSRHRGVSIDTESVANLQWADGQEYSQEFGTSSNRLGPHRLDIVGMGAIVKLNNGTTFEIEGTRLTENVDEDAPLALSFDVLNSGTLSTAVTGEIGRYQHAKVVLQGSSSAQQTSSPASLASQGVSVKLVWGHNWTEDSERICGH